MMRFSGLGALEMRKNELDRLVLDERLPASARQRQLIRFICTEELQGRGDRLKAFTIATQALGRGLDFDPQSDSIVRVEIGRLRQLLDLYYSKLEPSPVIRIVIPKGTYRPNFVDGRDVAKADIQLSMAGWVSRLKRRLGGLPAFSANAVILSVTLAILVAFLYRSEIAKLYYPDARRLYAHNTSALTEKKLVVAPVRINVDGREGALIAALIRDKIVKSLTENVKTFHVQSSSENNDGINVDMVLRTSIFVNDELLIINYIIVDAEKSAASAQGSFQIVINNSTLESLGNIISAELHRRIIVVFDKKSHSVEKPDVG